MKKTICHMTHLDNLESIIKRGELLSRNHSINYKDIANKNVQDKRAKVAVPINPGGTLHDYVPFYFCGQTPMLLVQQLQQKDIIFLVSSTNIVSNAGLEFVFTDRHAVIQYANFYNKLNDLNSLDWDAIKCKYWGNPADDTKEKKQAEFLIYNKMPWQFIYGIGVIDEDVDYNVQLILDGLKHRPVIKVKKEWYFIWSN